MSAADDLIFGIHAVQAALDAGEVAMLWVMAGREDERLRPILQSARQQRLSIESRSREQMDRQLGNARHQGVMARLKPIRPWQLEDLLEHLDTQSAPPFVLILDGLQDPHNVGACLRTAEAAGVHGVILLKDRACPINATVRKVASGAASRLPIAQVTNLVRSMEQLKACGLWLIGLAGEGPASLYEQDLRTPLGIVMGAEGEGLRRLTREHCDVLARIPMQGGCGSLNVSVAAGVALFEAVRQRQAPA